MASLCGRLEEFEDKADMEVDLVRAAMPLYALTFTPTAP
jgi:hypothetical protein